MEFGLGIVLGVLFVNDYLPRSRKWRMPVAMIGVVAFAIMLLGPRLWTNTDRAFMFGVPAFVIIGCALIAERSGLVLNGRWLQLLGAASYSIYLTHFFSTQIVVKLAEHLSRFGTPMMVALVFVAFAMVILVGIAVHIKVELPLTAMVRRMSRQRRRVLAVAASAESVPILTPTES